MNRGERLARLRAAERRANWRDRDMRYGNTYRAPYGIHTSKQKKQASKWDDVMVVALLLLLGLMIASM